MSARGRLTFDRCMRTYYTAKQRKKLLAYWENVEVQKNLALPKELEDIPSSLQKKWLILLVQEDEALKKSKETKKISFLTRVKRFFHKIYSKF